MNFLRLIRFTNLIIVAFTQYLLQYYILLPELKKVNLSPLLPHFEFFLLVFSTILIAAGGYIINDIEDVEIDRLNKPEKKQIVGRIYPLSISWKMYLFSIILGFIISIYLALFIHNFLQLLIYPAAVGMLYAYSKWWKRQPLIGNLVVSFFCAFVAWIVFYAEKINFISEKLHDVIAMNEAISFSTAQQQGYDFLKITFGGYAVFAFISTLFREIIKDIEDVQGDKAGNCRTLPVVIGVEKSKKWAFVVGLIFLILVVIFSFILRGDWVKILILNLSISLPIIYALFLLVKSQEKEDFSFLSKLAKFIMLSGLVFILIMKL